MLLNDFVSVLFWCIQIFDRKLLDDRYSSFFMTEKIMWITECVIFIALYSVYYDEVESTAQYSRVLLNRLLFYSYSSVFLDKYFNSLTFFWKEIVLLHVFTHTHAHTHTHALSHSCTHTYTHTHTLTYMHTHTHTHAHTRTHKHTHTHTCHLVYTFVIRCDVWLFYYYCINYRIYSVAKILLNADPYCVRWE